MADEVTRYRDRKFLVLLYPDDPSHKSALERLKGPEFRAIGICHNKDEWTKEDEEENPEHIAGTLKKDHWHFAVKYKNAVWNTSLASDLGIDIRFIRSVKTFDEAALYLIHFNNPDKYQYDVDECVGSCLPELKKLVADEKEDMRVLKILGLIERQGYLTYSDFLRLCCNNGLYSDVRRAGYLMVQVLREHNEEFLRESQKKDSFANDRERFADFAAFTGDKDILPL